MLPEDHKEYLLGRTMLALPNQHPLDQYREHWPRLQLAIGDVARVTSDKYPGFRAIDIGANIGDTAAVICARDDVPTLCVEGNPASWPYLEENARRIGAHVAISHSFVGGTAGERALTIADHLAGTAKLVDSEDGARVVLKTLAQLLDEHPDFAAAKLIKTDIDGFDFEVIRDSIGLLRALQPVLFFEYAPMESMTGPADGWQCFKLLTGIGYKWFLVWDGFGHYMVHLDADDFDQLVDLTFFLVANRRFGAAIYHYDICAFPAADTDLFEATRRIQLELCMQ